MTREDIENAVNMAIDKTNRAFDGSRFYEITQQTYVKAIIEELMSHIESQGKKDPIQEGVHPDPYQLLVPASLYELLVKERMRYYDALVEIIAANGSFRAEQAAEDMVRIATTALSEKPGKP